MLCLETQPFLSALSNTSVMCPFFIESYLHMKSACFTYTTYLPSERCKSSIPPCRTFLHGWGKMKLFYLSFFFPNPFLLCFVRPLYPLCPHLAQLKMPTLQGTEREVSKPFVLVDSASPSRWIFPQCCRLAPTRELRWAIPRWWNTAMLSQRTWSQRHLSPAILMCLLEIRAAAFKK